MIRLRSTAKPKSSSATLLRPAVAREKLFIATKLEAPRPSRAQAFARPLYRLKSSICCSCTMYAILSSRLHNSRNGKRKASAAMSASPRHASTNYAAIEAVLAREKPDSYRSIIRSTTAKPRNASCPWRPRVKALVLTALPFSRARLFRAVRGKELPGLGQNNCRQLSPILY